MALATDAIDSAIESVEDVGLVNNEDVCDGVFFAITNVIFI